MPLHFESRSGSAVDVDNKIMIPPPRILPADIPASRNDTEYQYSIYSNGNRVDGLVFLEATISKIDPTARNGYSF